MIYFLSDLPASLIRMARFLKPGGAVFLVFADETASYSGVSTRIFIESGGDTGQNPQHLEAPAERLRLLAASDEGGGEILSVLHSALPGASFELDSASQRNRLYGHSLADLIALANLSVLGRVHGTAKFMTTCSLLLEEPERVDLRIEDEGPRKGMWSVQAPQRVVVIRRCADGPPASGLAENPITTGHADESGSEDDSHVEARPSGCGEVPVRIDRPAADTLAARLDEALDLVRNEFEKLDPSRQYHNAYARVLKHDPLEQVPTLGTDRYDRLASMLADVLVRMARLLKPDGAVFISVADETDGYTGAALQNFIDSGGDTGDHDRCLTGIQERHRLLAAPAEGGGNLLNVLEAELPKRSFELETVRHPTRLYAHALADLIAMANITGLSEVPGTTKFITTCNLLQHEPEAVDLRIENHGPRKGMWSVAQPSLVVVIRRTRGNRS